ncbi:peroxidase family protein [Alteromonadaceae bacterium BrNp21-10]|nr:peroxidase family protein [Alteromonadaceae bacterium BrNp21-10]
MDNHDFRLFPLRSINPLLSEQQLTALSTELTGGGNHSPVATTAQATTLFNNTKGAAVKPQLNTPIYPHHRIDAGYTYLGQFIAHDIVPKSNPREQCRPLSPWLNLDSLYGHPSNDTEGKAVFDDSLFDADGQFLIHTNQFDARRDANGRAIIAEPRNDENAVIIQLHVVWQKVHNLIVKQLPQPHTRTSNIQRARCQVLALFHLIVIDDFLRRLLEPTVFRYYFQDWRAGVLPAEHSLTSIPVEFSHAGFRFGHSMTLGFYDLNSMPDNVFSLADLLRSPSSPPLQAKHQIEWSKFFGGNALEARRMSMLISMDMTHIPIEGNIIHINLLAGQNKQLPTAKQIIDWLITSHPQLATAIELETYPQVTADSDKRLAGAYHTLADNFAHERLPLWLYILGEAKLNPPPNTKTKLGKVGSIINAEVLRSSIVSCYFHKTDNILSANSLMSLLQRNAGDLYLQIRDNSPDGCCTMFNLINWINKENNNEH